MVKKIVFAFFVTMFAGSAFGQVVSRSCGAHDFDLRAYEQGNLTLVEADDATGGTVSSYIGIWVQRSERGARLTVKAEDHGTPFGLTVTVPVDSNGILQADYNAYLLLRLQTAKHEVAGDNPDHWSLFIVLTIRDINRALAACAT